MLDAVLVNNRMPDRAILDRYKKEGAQLVTADAAVHEMGIRVIDADLVERMDQQRVLWEKQDLLRHDPEKLAQLIIDVR